MMEDDFENVFDESDLISSSPAMQISEIFAPAMQSNFTFSNASNIID